jgi:hypothetical protein
MSTYMTPIAKFLAVDEVPGGHHRALAATELIVLVGRSGVTMTKTLTTMWRASTLMLAVVQERTVAHCHGVWRPLLRPMLGYITATT